MADSEGYNIKNEVERRLDRIFGDEDESPIIPGSSDANEYQDATLTDLKDYIHSLDTFSDKTLMGMKIEVKKVMQKSTADKSLSLFLKLLVSIGQHLSEIPSNLQPEGIGLIRSTFDSLESVVTSKDINDDDKKRRLVDAAAEFKEFREKADMATTEVTQPAEPVAPEAAVETGKETGLQSASQMVTSAVDEIRDLIRAEFDALKTVLKRAG